MPDLKWWQKAVFYQIYPRSFADRNGDGIGDFQGMIDRLDYLKDLGVDAVWLSPHYPTPMFDCGYDIAGYTEVAPEYGRLDDFKRFLDGLHRRDMRLIIDLVLNHTSDQHPWFQESHSSRDNPKRDWYVWRDGKQDSPPNNWYSVFGGPAWEHDPLTGQYYYHFFFKQQPDLNWNNPAVKQAMFDAVRFWLDMGVDGFRLDAIGTIFEDPEMPDHTASFSQAELYKINRNSGYPEEELRQDQEFELMFANQVDQPGVHLLMQELRQVVDAYEERVLVGETDEITYYGDGSNELHMVFNFPLMSTPRMTPAWIRANQQQRLSTLPPAAWPCNTLGNHDSPRVYSRYGDGLNDEAIARLSLALMLALRGTPFLYNGEEIGMTDLLLTDLSQFRDLLGVWAYEMETEILGVTPEEAEIHAATYGRDKCRTPLQWRNAPNGGFSPPGIETWLPVNPNYAQGVNVEDQEADPVSLLTFYKRMLSLRKNSPALIAGEYFPLNEDAPDYLSFLRHSTEQDCLVVLNYSASSHTLRFDALEALVEGLERPAARLLFSSHDRAGKSEELTRLEIAPYEIYIAELVGDG